ncbi:MAG TPA: HAMP domain-containing protein, partial [Candidatus Ozemobacteraceae bacterium]|nr:HAMP domain-containing protein [Candidatus Ozemobacteraceae bacterium]
MSIVPAGAGWVVVKRAVAEYGRAELRAKVDDLHRDLTNLDNGGNRLHATLIGMLRRLSRTPDTLARLERGDSPVTLRSALRFLIDACDLEGEYPDLNGPDLLLCVAPDDRTSIVSRLTKNSESVTNSERPLLEVFGPLVKKMRDGIKRSWREEAPGEPVSEATKLRETMKSDMLYDLYIAIFGIDALISQISFPEELIDVKTSFMRIFIIGLRVFRATGIPTDWLLFSIWDDSKELAYVRRVFEERFSGRFGAWHRLAVSEASGTPDDEPDAPEIWVITGLAEHIFGGWIAPGHARMPKAMQEAIERARNSGIIQTGRDMAAPGRPVFEAFLGNHLSRFILAGQVETNSIERRVQRLQTAGNIVAVGLVVIALVLAWQGRRWLLEPLERLRLAMGRIAEGRDQIRIPVDRSDEFGTLAVAFNSMARALEEAAILGRFVSGAVRRAVRDRKSDESGRGEHREVTVLFSCLFHFDRVCAEKNAAQVFDTLGAHLGALNAELEPFAAGAEIDKVIGDKILVVFDHERLGGNARAAAAVLAVVNGVRRRMAAAG